MVRDSSTGFVSIRRNACCGLGPEPLAERRGVVLEKLPTFIADRQSFSFLLAFVGACGHAFYLFVGKGALRPPTASF